MKSIEVGDLAPDFSATASDGRIVTLGEYQGKQIVVLFFYPRDHSLVCTREACAFRDVYSDLVAMGAAVIGVSGDSDSSHQSFVSRQRLPYQLIADEDGSLRRLFGVWKSWVILPARVTFVIDRKGIVTQKFRSLLSGAKHVEEAMKAVRKINGSANPTT